MSKQKSFITFDFYLQSVLIGIPLACFLFGLIASISELWIFSLFGLIFIGAWQLLSGLIHASAFRDRIRKYYLIAALSNLLLIFLAYQLPFQGESVRLLLIFLLPATIAIWYYGLTYRDYFRKRNQLQSFWDLR